MSKDFGFPSYVTLKIIDAIIADIILLDDILEVNSVIDPRNERK